MSPQTRDIIPCVWIMLAIIMPVLMFLSPLVESLALFWLPFAFVAIAIPSAGMCGLGILPQEQRRRGFARFAFWWHVVCLIVPPTVFFGGCGMPVFRQWFTIYQVEAFVGWLMVGGYAVAILLNLIQIVIFRCGDLVTTLIAQVIFAVVFFMAVGLAPNMIAD